MTNIKQMTFHELAEKVLSASSIPLTSNEIWKIAEEKGYTILLGSKGKTPWDTLAARLYSITKLDRILIKQFL